MVLSHTIPRKPITTLKQYGWFGVTKFSILSLLLVLVFMNSAQAGRYYSLHSPWFHDTPIYGATPEKTCRAYIANANVILMRGWRYGSISPALQFPFGAYPYYCNYEYTIRSGSIVKHSSELIALMDEDCSIELKENGTGECVTPATNPKQPQSCPLASKGPKLILGNPIIIATGNKFQTEVDYQSQNPFGLSFVRYYNSVGYNVTTDIGIKWRHNGNNRIAVNSTTETLMYRNSGQVFTFNYDGSNWVGDVDISDTLVELKDAGNNRTGWQYTTSNDNVEVYNLSGQLIAITNRQGQAKVLSYDIAVIDGGDDDNSTLDKITGFNNEVMTFTYDTNQYVKRITSMTDPQGNTYLYSYDAIGNLQTVTYPDSTSRTYHYENTTFPHHLTGITDETGIRYATWQYDSQGRAISSEHTGGTDIGTLVYNADDSVTTTDTLGKQTTYHFTTLHGVKKVTQVEGHASASCAAANKNYTYDANGYLQSKTDWQGKVTTYVHDARGLETSRTEAAGTPEARTITTDWHATFRLPIKITEPGKVTNYSYDTQGRLTSQTSHTP